MLITLPEHDERTSICSKLNEEVISTSEKSDVDVFDLRKDRANRKTVTGILLKKKPKLVVFNGHGNEETICGHDDNVLIKVDDNEELLERKIVYTIACNSVKKLGPQCIKKGTKTFIGYREVFAWMTDKYARSIERDAIAKDIFAPSNTIPIAIIKGHTTGEAYAKSQKIAEDKILYYKLNEENLPEAPNVLQLLLWNKTNQAILGDTEAKF